MLRWQEEEMTRRGAGEGERDEKVEGRGRRQGEGATDFGFRFEDGARVETLITSHLLLKMAKGRQEL